MTSEYTHVHHWSIDAVSNEGTCRRCGAQKSFPTWREEDWGADWRRAQRSELTKPFDDDGIRSSDLAHFRQSNGEAF